MGLTRRARGQLALTAGPPVTVLNGPGLIVLSDSGMQGGNATFEDFSQLGFRVRPEKQELRCNFSRAQLWQIPCKGKN